MNCQVVKKALLKIKERKIKAENIAYIHLQDLLTDNEFKTIYKEKKTAEIENAKSQILGEKEKYDLNEIENKLQNYLLNKNLGKDYLKTNYTCPLCKDTGIIDGEMCNCLINEVNNVLLEESGIKHNLFSFDDAITNDNTTEIYNKMKQWCDKDSKIINILFTGNTGVGKTFLMECMANRLIKNKNLICWTSSFNLNQDLLSYRTALEEDKNKYIEKYLLTKYLFIDDLGAEPILNNVTREGMYLILSERMENNLKTIISSNLSLGEIEETYDERFFSRLLQKNKSLILEIINEDLRIKGIKK